MMLWLLFRMRLGGTRPTSVSLLTRSYQRRQTQRITTSKPQLTYKQLRHWMMLDWSLLENVKVTHFVLY